MVLQQSQNLILRVKRDFSKIMNPLALFKLEMIISPLSTRIFIILPNRTKNIQHIKQERNIWLANKFCCKVFSNLLSTSTIILTQMSLRKIDQFKTNKKPIDEYISKYF